MAVEQAAHADLPIIVGADALIAFLFVAGGAPIDLSGDTIELDVAWGTHAVSFGDGAGLTVSAGEGRVEWAVTQSFSSIVPRGKIARFDLWRTMPVVGRRLYLTGVLVGSPVAGAALPGDLAVTINVNDGPIEVAINVITGLPGVGVPTGGAAGQVLAKRSDGAFDAEWIDPPEAGDVSELEQRVDELQGGKADVVYVEQAIAEATAARPKAWQRDALYRAAVPRMADSDAPVLIDIHVDGQSLSNNTLSEGRSRDYQPRPINALMKELAGGPELQGPIKFGHAFTGDLIPLVEGLATRPNPTVVNPATGEVTTWAPGNGGDFASALADELLDQIAASGLPLDKVRICVTQVGIGGRAYKELTAGTLSDKWLRESVTVGHQYARDRGWGYLPIKLWVHGETDSNQNPVAGDDEPVLSNDMTAREYAAYLLQDRARFRDIVREITGTDYDPWFFTDQCGSTFPGGWRKSDMRLANTAEGQRLATHMDPRIVGGPSNYAPWLVDRLHGFMLAYNFLARMFGDPIFRTIFGNGRYRPPEMIAGRRTSPTKGRVIVDNAAGELRIQRYMVNEWSLASGGANYRVGDEIRALGMDTAARWVVEAVDGAGAITACRITDAGSHKLPADAAPLAGVVATQAQITGATVANPGTGTALDGAYARVQGGAYTKQAVFQVIAPLGTVTGFLLFEAGDYSALPANPVAMTTGGVTGLTANINSLGSGATFNVLSYRQLCHTNEVPFFQSAASSSAAKTIQAVGAGYKRGDVAYAVGGVVAAGGHPASINVGIIDGAGGVTNAGMRSGGIYKVLPPQPVEYRSTTGSGCTITSPESCFPVADPGNCGIDIDDDTPLTVEGIETDTGLRPPRVVSDGIQIVNDADVSQTAFEITVDQLWGRSTWIMAGQRPQGANGPTAGGRTNIASPPPKGSKPGPFGVFPQAWLWRGGIRLDTPDYQPNLPMLDNTRFMVAQDGAPDAFVVPANSGVWPIDRWRVYRAVAGARVSRVAGGRQTYALRLQRVAGDTATSQIQCTQPIIGEAIAAAVAKNIVASVRGRFGADAKGAALVRVFAYPSIVAYSGQVPPGGTTLLVRNIAADQTGWGSRYIGSAAQLAVNDVVVPAGTQMLILSITYTPGSEAAGAADYFEFEEPSLNTGTMLRVFVPLSAAEEEDRARRWYRKPTGGLYVGTTPTVHALNPPMRATPVVTGGGAGFASTNSTASALVVSQTAAAVQPLILDARL